MHDCHVISQTKPVPIPISSENFPGKDPERGWESSQLLYECGKNERELGTMSDC